MHAMSANAAGQIGSIIAAAIILLIAFGSVVAMGLLFGPLGVLVATPLALVGMILVQELYIHDILERQPK